MRELQESDAIIAIVDDDPSVREGSQWFDQVEGANYNLRQGEWTAG